MRKTSPNVFANASNNNNNARAAQARMKLMTPSSYGLEDVLRFSKGVSQDENKFRSYVGADSAIGWDNAVKQWVNSDTGAPLPAPSEDAAKKNCGDEKL